ncbi:CDP-glycerol glycerophosphotransferase family protein [Nocardiopsis sp. MG754419]|uniref:CDP-glycerol glycerophosphotransferase family protein n=1 Tax=Nocardiopsis sp. MG754419 TaxID=2259865 RepID=UPI001BADEE15|nr:CDP-glycerol glycerophosphotransferase family protein [Nocardiopsis sp. MG754419]MBR8742476.1 CDP-glycerol glycerophosphotransferase family protein [Nocardiopsis sp. MG754419]
MPEPTVIVTFDVTEPHLQNCLDSLARQRDDSHVEVAPSEGSVRPDTEVVLVPVRNGAAAASRPTDPEAPEGRTTEPDANGENGDDESTEAVPDETGPDEPGPEENDQGDEAVAPVREDGLAVARAFAKAPPAGLRVRFLDGDPAPHHPEARARGAAAAAGSHLLFLSGSDALTGYAVAHLTHSAADTRSDLVIGNVHRFNELGAAPSKAHRKLCGHVRLAEDPRNIPGLASDATLGNRLWRKEFWLSQAVPETDPEDDDLAIRRLSLRADAVDVLPAPVLLMRERTRVRLPLEEDALTRRLTTMRRIAEDLTVADRELWDRTLLAGELHGLLLRLDDADAPVRDTAIDLLNAYLDHVDGALLRALPVLDRLLYHLVRKRRVDDVLEVATFAKSVEIKKATAVRQGLGYYIRYPFFETDDPAKAVPRELYRLEDEIKVRQKTEAVHWEDGRLHIGGRVGIRHLRAHKRWHQHIVAFAVNTVTKRRIRVPVQVRLAAEYRLPDLPDAARHDYGGFTAILDPRRLRSARTWEPGDWRIELVVFNRGLTRRKFLSNPLSGQPERPGYHNVDDDVWIRPHWNKDRHLVVSVEPARARVTEHRFDAHTAELLVGGELLSPPAAEATELRLIRRPGTARLSYPVRIEGGRFSARVRAEELFARGLSECGGVIRQEEWDAELVTRDGARVPLILPDEVPGSPYNSDGAQQELVVLRTATGHLKLRAGRARPVVDSAEWNERTLVLGGEFPTGVDLRIVAKARGRDEEHELVVERDGGRFTTRFDPSRITTLSGEISLPAGSYQLWGRIGEEIADEAPGAATEVESVDVGVEFADALIGRLPSETRSPERTYTLTYQNRGIPVIQVGSDLRPVERGAFAQRRLREVFYPAQRELPVTEGVLFDTYTGRQYSDSPQSIYAELRGRGQWADYPMSWLVADGQVRLPEDLTPVRHKGEEYHRELARSRYLVTNSRQPNWFHRHPDQTVVQTWHGSMLKRIGFDVDNIRGKSRDYFDKLAWETRQWDYLVSPSPWATPILRSAFRFEGEILETGYPRNDIFFAADRERVAERTRRLLGLPEGKKVVLYAPTWRDDKYYTRGKHKLDLHLDLRRMYEKLGDDHVLLVRRHPRVVDSVPIVGEDFVYDVSLYPEIMELFLITDVLITDYSSMMFDFANTGRPMLFFTYDLEGYRDNLRGFYFDFEETAPGPLLTESDDVIAALLDIDEVAERSGASYRAFVEQFCPLDDGHAAARVVDRVFGA